MLRYRIKINVAKSEFFQKEVTFLGHVIDTNGIKKSPEFIERIRTYPKPKTVTELRQFLGLCNFQRKFIKNCSTISKPLSEKTTGPKRKLIEWTPEMHKSFDELKNQLIADVQLSFPDYSEDAQLLEVFADASSKGVGAFIGQQQGETYKTIAYASTTFSPAQVRYSTLEKELCALRFAVKTFRPFLLGVKFVLYTDHRPLAISTEYGIRKLSTNKNDK